MLRNKRIIIAATVVLLVFAFAAPPATQAKDSGEYEAIVKHLKTKYKAKKVRIPFMWLARFAVSVVRPAGVKSFSVTLFQDLKFSKETLDLDMQDAMKRSFGAEWTSIMHVRSRTGEQVYMYMREDGKNVKIAMVTVEKDQAAVIRATFSPEKLAEFINNPRVFGVSLGDDGKKVKTPTDSPKSDAIPEMEKQ